MSEEKTKIENAWEIILDELGENPQREGLKETPKRIARMYKEIFRGYDPKQKPKITIFDNGADGINYDQMITDRGKYYSQCEHHGVPFFGEYVFGYIPDKKIVGLSKVARLVDYHAAKFQIQERLVTEIIDDLEEALHPKGIGIYMRGTHLCKVMRGAKKDGVMTTCDLRGCFKERGAKEEFLQEAKR